MTDSPIAHSHDDPTTSKVEARIEYLRSQAQWDAIAHWCQQAGSENPLAINEKRQVVWPKGREAIELTQSFTLPEHLQDFALAGLKARLALTWWAEQAAVYVNGKLVQAGDLFDHSARVVLSESVQPGEVVEVRLKLISPGHDIGAVMRSKLIFESPYDQLDPGFVADEIAVVLSYLKQFAPAEIPQLATALAQVEPLDLNANHTCLMFWSDRIKAHKITLLGHAHLDMAWLWPVAETWEAAERTFVSALNLQKDFPDLTFCHTTPALYEWMEQHRPEIFAAIQTQAKAGKWEALGGMWVEPELNVLDEESIARHILYGQAYYQEKFGQISRIAWLPDTFGFCWQLPQLLKLGGMDYFVTQKLRWNDTTKYPHEVFNWRSPDGSEVLSLMTGPIGEGIDPTKLADYCWEWTQRTGNQQPLWLLGVGDHGGGPTRDMLELARRWMGSPVFPQMVFGTAGDYLQIWGDRVDRGAGFVGRESVGVGDDWLNPPLPVHNADLYLEFHRGCYTTHADQKSLNRDCQNALYQAELWSSLATLLNLQTYPQSELETAWKQTLFNQFHDILPGTSITQVFQEAMPQWLTSLKTAKGLTQQAMQTIAQSINLPELPHPNALPIVLFNSLGWSKSQVIRLAMQLPQPPDRPIAWQIIYLDGSTASAYVEADGKNYGQVWVEFPVHDVPAFGYQLCWLVTVASPVEMPEVEDSYTIENEFLKLQVDSESGDIKSLWDKQNQRQVFSDYANQIECFRDSGQYWDAWNIDPNYQNHPLPPSQHFDIVRMDSLHTQELWAGGQNGFRGYILESGSPVLKIKMQLKGDERHVLQKATFPLNLETDDLRSRATYDTAAGAIDRPTRPQTEAEKAQWEVPGLRWADLSSEDYGVSILSDRKHGYDHKPNEIRLTLLRSPEWPDPETDKGIHRFSFAIYPHAGNWQTAKTVQKSREFSQPLQAIVLTNPQTEGTLPTEASLLNLGAENLVLTALKRSQTHPNTFILRCYEAHGTSTQLNLSNAFGGKLGDRLDLLERPIADQTTSVQPWQIATIALQASK